MAQIFVENQELYENFFEQTDFFDEPEAKETLSTGNHEICQNCIDEDRFCDIHGAKPKSSLLRRNAIRRGAVGELTLVEQLKQAKARFVCNFFL